MGLPLLFFMLLACSPKQPNDLETSDLLSTAEIREKVAALNCPADKITIPPPEKMGGTLRFNIMETINGLDPAWIRDTASMFSGECLHEGLVQYDPVDLSITPCIADRWEISSDGLEYTFHIRKGVLFHDNPCFPEGKGREVLATDFKYSFERICDPTVASPGSWMFVGFLKGATAYRDGISARLELERRKQGGIQEQSDDRFRSATQGDLQTMAATPPEVAGLICPDSRTLVIRLEFPFSPFIYRLGHSFSWVVPKEAVERYGPDFYRNPVGAGPFQFREWITDQRLVFVRNENYWEKDTDGNPYPYLQQIEITCIGDANSEHFEFKSGHLHFHYVPIDQWDSVFTPELSLTTEYSSFQVQSAEMMAIEYYGMLNTDPVFKDRRVRQAFNHAVNREELASTLLRYRILPNEGQVVPGAMPGYQSEPGPYQYDPDKARRLLAEAGYPDGKNFPPLTLQLNSAGKENIKVAEVLQGYFHQIGVNVRLQVADWRVHLDQMRAGKLSFYRSGWFNDYPSPENSLMLLHSGNIPPEGENYVRYSNPEFDRFYEAALRSVSAEEQIQLYRQAERIAVDDAAWLFLYFQRYFRLLAPEVRGFPMNTIGRRFLKYVWLDQRG